MFSSQAAAETPAGSSDAVEQVGVPNTAANKTAEFNRQSAVSAFLTSAGSFRTVSKTRFKRKTAEVHFISIA